MLSSALLLAIWLTLYDFAIKQYEFIEQDRRTQLWVGTLLLSEGLLYINAYIQINFLPSNYWRNEISAATILIAILLTGRLIIQKKLINYIKAPFATQPITNKWIIGIGFTGLVGFGLLTASQQNGDANTYNLARLLTMTASSSTTLAVDTANIRQALFAQAHDLIYYTDIALGNSRGLPLISTVELLATLATLINIGNSLSAEKGLLNNEIKGKKIRKTAYFLIIIFLLGSNLQIMQALVTKNDLIITLLFTASIDNLVSLNSKKGSPQGPVDIERIALLLYIIILGVAAKAYGLIVAIPAFLYGLFGAVYYLKKFGLDFDHETIKARKRIKFKLTTLIMSIGIIVLIISSYQTSLTARTWENHPRIWLSTERWVNTQGSLKERIYNSVLNTQRYLVQGVLFPFSSNRSYFPIGPDVSPLIESTMVPRWLEVDQGVAPASGRYKLLDTTNPDLGYPSFLSQIGIMAGGGLWIMLLRKKPLNNGTIIIGSCLLSYITISSAILYQTWGSRFLGTLYIPIIPVSAVAIGSVIESHKLSISSKSRKIAKYCFISVTMLSLLSSVATSGYISRNFGMPQSTYGYYLQHLIVERSFSHAQADSWVEVLGNLNGEDIVLCGDEGTWTYTPMLLTRNKYRGKMKLLNRHKCSIMTSFNETPRIKDRVQTFNGVTYVWLP